MHNSESSSLARFGAGLWGFILAAIILKMFGAITFSFVQGMPMSAALALTFIVPIGLSIIVYNAIASPAIKKGMAAYYIAAVAMMIAFGVAAGFGIINMF